MTDKGYMMEELLRRYFLSAGYYVTRGVPFIYEGFSITDIDLWLYGRTSSVSREIAIVDIKNKKTPQVIERIFWVKGLQQAVNATNAMVATTDKRQEVKDFGRELGVLVLDGNFLNKLSNSIEDMKNRLSDEDFIHKIEEYSLGKLDGDWKGRYLESKSLLSYGLSFDSCNQWLEHARFFADQVLLKPTQKETALRCFYLICSYIAISIDFILKELSFLEVTERSRLISEGLTYGAKGKTGFNRMLRMSLSILEEYTTNGAATSNQARNNIEKELSKLPTNILGEFFGKSDIVKSIFNIGKDLESLAMKTQFTTHLNSSLELKGLIGALLDYWNIERMHFNEIIQNN